MKDDLKNNYFKLNSPVIMPNASGFLWNNKMLIQATCRGFMTAQYMQPEPAKYSHAPNIEAKTFMQPELPYYVDHPGRFTFIKDEDRGTTFSVPYEPMRKTTYKFEFSVGRSDINWYAENDGIGVNMNVSLPKDETLELWKISVKNTSQYRKKVSIYPYFTVGYMSWMNQGGKYDPQLNAIVCSSITPYQDYKDYFRIKHYKDITFLLAEEEPYSWEAAQKDFEGEGGLFNPAGINAEKLSKSTAEYETPVCVFQYKLELLPQEEKEFRFIFGPANTKEEIFFYKKKYFQNPDGNGTTVFNHIKKEYDAYIAESQKNFSVKTEDKNFDEFVNLWLPRQVYYHGITNRMTCDPQTRNFFQDNMGMCYIKPEMGNEALLFALRQQSKSGQMPDGIKLEKNTELKYINKIPHTDHCVWLPICLEVYLDETDDYDILKAEIPFAEGDETASVFEHIDRGLKWLMRNTDRRGLCLIDQGDWCDPMNMVGYRGKGVSAWLTMAASYACNVWTKISERAGRPDKAAEYKGIADRLNNTINKYFWANKWYARGITDENRVFGTDNDQEGKIFINPQSWALLCGAADEERMSSIFEMVEKYLETPYGVEKLAPAYTSMREDIGRLTQKYPGTAENGSVYNHAAIFYIYALYRIGKVQDAYRLLRKMIPDPASENFVKREQLPVFIPNYYRGAYRQMPKNAGKSSQLMNTGSVSWMYRCIIECLFGIQGNREGLIINPQFPSHWEQADVRRIFRGAEFFIHIQREEGIQNVEVYVDGKYAERNIIRNIKRGTCYQVLVKLPVERMAGPV